MFADYKTIKSLKGTDRKLYQYMITHVNEVSTMNIRDFAGINGVSAATVVRFCKAMNCSGFAELKKSLQAYVKGENIPDVQENNHELIEFLKWADTKEFADQIDTFASYVLAKNTIFLLGIGNSGAVARYGARYLTNVGLFSFVIDDAFYPYELNGDDYCVIVFSESGETVEVIQQVQHYKEQGAKILVITNNESSSLAFYADALIAYHVRHSQLISTYNLTTQVPPVYIIERLGMRIREISKSK